MKEQDAWLPIALCSNHKPIKLSQKRKKITILPKIPYVSSCKGLEKRPKDIQMYDMLQCKDFRFNHPSPCSYRALFPTSWKTWHGKALITVLFHRQIFFSKDTVFIFMRKEHLTWESSASNFSESVVAIISNCSAFCTGKVVSGKYTEHWQVPSSSTVPDTLPKSCNNKSLGEKSLIFFSGINS